MFDEYFQCKKEIAAFFDLEEIFVDVKDCRKEMWGRDCDIILWGLEESNWKHETRITQTHKHNGYVLVFNQYQGLLFVEDTEIT